MMKSTQCGTRVPRSMPVGWRDAWQLWSEDLFRHARAAVSSLAMRLAIAVRGMPLVLLVLLPAFFHIGALQPARTADLLLLLLAFATIHLAVILLAAPAVRREGMPDLRLLGVPLLPAGLALAARGGHEALLPAGLFALVQAARWLVPAPPPPVELLLVAAAGALCFDAGASATVLDGSPELLLWAAALACFARMATDRRDLALPAGGGAVGERPDGRLWEMGQGFAALFTLLFSIVHVAGRPPGTVWQTAALYASLLFLLALLWRGWQRPPDPESGLDPAWVVGFIGWALTTTVAHQSGMTVLPIG